MMAISTCAGLGAGICGQLLYPGAYLADATGYGAHDIQGFLFYIFGNMFFYVVISFLVMIFASRLIRLRHPTKDHSAEVRDDRVI